MGNSREEIGKAGKRDRLTRTENMILSVLEKKPGRAVTRREILVEVWPQAQYSINAATVDKHISSIRKKLRGRAKILSIHGTGYLLARKTGKKTPKKT